MHRGFHRLAVSAVAVGVVVGAPFAVLAVVASPVGALTTIPVASPTDAALRAAFTTANATADDVEIDINVGSATIPLSGGELLYTGGAGGTHTLTVKGNGATISQGTAGARVFEFSTGSNLAPLTLDNLTITGGNVTGATLGGAVKSSHGLVISNSTVTGNTSATSIIEATNTTTTTNSTFTNNTVTSVGRDCFGILDTGTTNVSGSTFTNNTCSSTTGDADGIFDTGTTTLTGSTVTGNHNTAVAGAADGILFPAGFTMSNTLIQNNVNTSVAGEADGIVDSGATTITNSSVVSNTNSTTSDTAFGTVFPTTMTVTNSTIANNSNSTATGTAFGAGIDSGPQNLTVKDSTIANNTNSGTVSKGGGIFQGSFGAASVSASSPKHGAKGGVGASATLTTTLVYDTIASNTATTGANIDAVGLVSFGSVVAVHQGGVNCVLVNATVSNGYNYSDDSTCGFTAATDKQNAADPMLGAVANNGGPGPTRLPQPGSPLIDAIAVAACQADGAAGITTDERGVTRPQGTGCDIGAVEVVPSVLITPKFTG